MLQRAASNAYSWWWASHIRTKQSKWLEQNLQDMEEKVKYMLKLVEGEGDTFAKRAEIYFRQRPELIIFVEEAYRAYRALAERYDHISGELQSANNTIATVFPEQIQYGMDEDDEDYDGSPRYRPPPVDQIKASKDLPQPPKTMPKALSFQMSIKKTPKMAPVPTTIAAPKSNLSKSEGLELMDKLQKEILALQTEKEFVKSSYESRLARYWEIENRVTEAQAKVCNLQDEFSMSNVIEDDEARTLMASTALQSCQDTLSQLQETHGRSAEEARIENHRIKAAQQKVEALKKKFRHEQMKQWNPFASDEDLTDYTATLEEEAEILRQQDVESEAIAKDIRKKLEMQSSSSLTATEMAEKIDELVKKVISLETMVSTPTGLINRLRLEINELQERLGNSEDNEAKSNSSNAKLGESEEKLHGIQDLNRKIEHQNSSLKIQFIEARCNLEHLSEKLQSMQHLEEDEIPATGYQKEEAGQVLSPNQQFDFGELNDFIAASNDPANVTDKMSSITFDDLTQNYEELNLSNEVVKQDPSFAGVDEKEEILEEDEPNWQQLFMNGLEGREKALLAEYTTVLRNFKEAKRQLSEVEKKNLDTISEMAVQIQELKNSNAMKDEEIRSLRQKLDLLQTNSADDQSDSAFDDLRKPPAMKLENQDVKFNQDQGFESMVKRNKSLAYGIEDHLNRIKSRKELNIILINEHQTLTSTEEKFRRNIDELLEENLDFWLRFSTSFHQIQKFQTVIQDLQAEFSDLTVNNKQDDGSSPSKTTSTDKSQKSRARPLYVHLREIQTEMDTWVEQSASLKAELESRFTSLCDIQEEISKTLKAGLEAGDLEFTSYQAAKFQGEILNMKQENNKVADELQAGQDFVTGFQSEVETTLTKMNDEFKLSGSKKHQNDIKHSIRSRIPLRSFIFGIKQKKQKPSVFACINPAYQKQYSDIQGHIPL
ncbi:hypothetical protein C5167_038185 [Papaver somniferum]|uniref:NAB domain-containing protein n=1 Tax=Papaver somniferum TaxID=3469 RepID=A0A4Y7ICL6_PAPSO|nr:protein NETWORKED 2D-like [Papaver somniferum]RZC45238.1 hypothetical protein C5167_038185 [Papaver somniferum]